jgi:hypothetical protein
MLARLERNPIYHVGSDLLTPVKSFIVQTPFFKVEKDFDSDLRIKLERLTLANISTLG